MVFNRSLKAGIKKILAKSILIVVFFTTVGVFVFNTVFAASNISIPVEIIWSGDTPTTRPAQVILELRKSGNSALLQTITLTSSNVDPNNANRWVGFFTNINANKNDVFEVTQQAVSNYQITTTGQTTVQQSAGISNFSTPSAITLPLAPTVNSLNLGTQYDYMLLFGDNGTTYLWTTNNYTGDRNEILDSINDILGTNLDSANVTFLTPGSTGSVFIRNSGQTTYLTLRGGAPTLTGVYAGSVESLSAPIITLTNTAAATHTLTVHHVNEDGTTFAPDTVTTYDDGDTYTATPINDPDFEPELQGGAATGVITSDIALTYVYHPIVYFAPTITATITNPQGSYQVGDTVNFSVTITNPENYALTDVHIAELLSGANFVSGTGYTLINDTEALIATLPANSSVTLQAQYPVIEDIAQNLVNEFQITAADAGAHHYFDPDGSYTANASFAIRAQDSPLTGIEASNLPPYVGFMIISLLGVAAMIIIKIRTTYRAR